MEILQQQFRVPEIYGDFWFNSDPIPLNALRGHVIMIDFWDYACQRCLQGLPYLQEWHRQYNDKGLVLIGVHTPQFPFGADALNVRKAIDKLGIKFPVVMDNNYSIWNSFRAMTWPSRYLVDKNGFIRYTQEGEGSYANFEHALQSLLTDAGYRDELPLVMEPIRESDKPGAICFRATPDILTGWQRGTIGNVEGFAPESTIHYDDPGVYLGGRIYLHGNWLNDRSYLKLNDPEGEEGRLIVSYEAKEVNMVIKSEGEKSFQVFIQQDASFLTKENKGDDVRIDEEGRSYFLVTEPKLYNVVKNPDFGEHKLKITTRSNGFALFSISFVSSVIPELIGKN